MGGVVDMAGDLLGGGHGARAISRTAFSGETGIGDVSFDPETGAVSSELSPEMQALQGALFGQAGTQLGQVGARGETALGLSENVLGQLGSFDPFAAAEEQFNRLDAILEPGRASARAGTAAGLLSTGRLGSTAGARTQASVEGEIERQRQQLLGEQFGKATDVQAQMANLGTGLGGFGLQQKGLQQQLGLGALEGGLGIDSQMQSLISTLAGSTAPVGTEAARESGAMQLAGGFMQGLGSVI